MRKILLTLVFAMAAFSSVWADFSADFSSKNPGIDTKTGLTSLSMNYNAEGWYLSHNSDINVSLFDNNSMGTFMLTSLSDLGLETLTGIRVMGHQQFFEDTGTWEFLLPTNIGLGTRTSADDVNFLTANLLSVDGADEFNGYGFIQTSGIEDYLWFYLGGIDFASEEVSLFDKPISYDLVFYGERTSGGSSAPEPATMLIFGIGLAGAGVAALRRRRK